VREVAATTLVEISKKKRDEVSRYKPYPISVIGKETLYEWKN